MKKHMTQEVAIKSAWMILEGLGYDRARNGDLEKTVTAVYESAPAADVEEVRHGYWKPVSCYEMFGGDQEAWYGHGDPIACHLCSKCNDYPPYDEDGNEILTKYCPNCGSKMMEDDNG